MDIRGRTFSVLGAARSGLAVAALLRGRGAEVFVSDSGKRETLREAEEKLTVLGIASEFGRNSLRVLDAETIVVSPGVPSGAEIVRRATAMGKAIVSEIEVAGWFCPAPIVAVTGTNGKTTTTALLGRMFEDAKRPALVGGNIGTAFSDIVGELSSSMTAILEVSSFQLDHIRTFHPKVAVLLNITPDHLDRYDHQFERYVASKRRIFENQGLGDVLIYNTDDEVTRVTVDQNVSRDVTLLPFSLRESLGQGAYLDGPTVILEWENTRDALISREEISIPGAHNLSNAMAAALAARVLSISCASIRATLKNFRGVEHRLEFVRELNGISYVNDSKATNVDSVWYAVQSFSSPIVLILGGRDKGNDYSPLIPLVRSHVRGILAIGESAEKIRTALSPIVPVEVCASMQEAVERGGHMARTGDVVLLSPACASFDWYENYEHRGRVFKEIVQRLGRNGSTSP